MNPARLLASLERFTTVLPAAVADIPPDDARWKPADGAWSILEIVRHLGDEEVDDFRTRLRMTLETPDQDWPSIDPEGWAAQRKYNEGHLPDAVAFFVKERRTSITWLKSLAAPRWDNVRRHPTFGEISAPSLLGAWAAHDALRLRQLAKRLFQIAQRDAAPHPVHYAGEWRA